ncbi:MAG TPA: ATP-binding protein [Gemmataceae bacterium]|nr:ATP-binding protein [Gemmataceae bacterium]
MTKEVVPLIDTFGVKMSTHGHAEKDVFGLRLALEEALVNAIKHGHRYDPSKRVAVRYCFQADCVLVEVEDQGPGFDPVAVPDPTDPENRERASGRGLFLMRAYASWVRHNRRGNCVRLCKYSSRLRSPDRAGSGIG